MINNHFWYKTALYQWHPWRQYINAGAMQTDTGACVHYSVHKRRRLEQVNRNYYRKQKNSELSKNSKKKFKKIKKKLKRFKYL